MITAIYLPLWTVPVTAYAVLLVLIGGDSLRRRRDRNRARRARRARIETMRQSRRYGA